MKNVSAQNEITGEIMPAAEFKTEVARIGVTEAALAELRSRYGKIKAITTKADYKLVLSGIGVLRKHRTSLDKLRLHLNSDDRARIEARNSEAKRITAEIVAIEEPLKELKQAEDARIEAEKAAAAAKEKSRIDGIRKMMIDNFGPNVIRPGAGIDDLGEAIRKMDSIGVDQAEFMEFTDEAKEMQRIALESLNDAWNAAVTQERERRIAEEENARIKAEQEAEAIELERQRLEFIRQHAEMKKERDRQAAELKKQQDEIAAQQAAIVAQQKAIDEEKQAQADAARKAAEAKAAKVEADRVAAEAAEQAERDRIAKEKAEATEIARQEALKPDKEKILAFAKLIEEMADNVRIMSDKMKSADSQELLQVVHDMMLEVADYARENCAEL
jgi:chemotaxis protein histidine kinase CheA